MRKHPLIALIAFTFVAASMFIGAAGVSSINNSVPVRATSHLKGESASSTVPTTNLRWLAATVRERARATAQLTAVVAHEKYLPFWQGLAGDRVAIHDSGRRQRACSRRHGASCSNPTLVQRQLLVQRQQHRQLRRLRRLRQLRQLRRRKRLRRLRQLRRLRRLRRLRQLRRLRRRKLPGQHRQQGRQ